MQRRSCPFDSGCIHDNTTEQSTNTVNAEEQSERFRGQCSLVSRTLRHTLDTQV